MILKKDIIVNMHNKLFIGIALLLSPFFANASVPCGTSAPGVLNVGFLPQNLPYSDWNETTNSAVGFDPLLISAAAKLIGYDTVNFIGYGTNADGLTDLATGIIDVYVNSEELLNTAAPYTTIGVVTDISSLSSTGEPNGWQLNLSCCELALQLETAVTYLVENGTYAKILQLVRLDDLTDGQVLGIPADQDGVLQSPFEFASSEIGTIPTDCAQSGPDFAVELPATNCMSAYLQANCTPAATFTGATGQSSSAE